MRYYELVEAPIADFETFGDMSREGSFRPDDLRAINNPKWRVKVVKAFEKVPYPVNLYLINGDENGKVRYDVGKYGFDAHYARDLDQINKWAGIRSPQFVQNMTRQPIKDAATSITIVLIENEGAERVPLSPWMIAHRFGHAVFIGGSNSLTPQPIDDITADILTTFGNFVVQCKEKLGAVWSVATIGTFRSARKDNLTQYGEFIIESLAQYMIQGRITYKYDRTRPELPNEEFYKKYFLRTKNLEEFVKAVLAGEYGFTERPKKSERRAYKKYHELEQQLVDMRNEWTRNPNIYEIPALVERFEGYMNASMEKLLSLCVGKVFVL